jgi:hypothetical protein
MSRATDAAKARRASRALDEKVRVEMYIDKVRKSLNITLRRRVQLATEYLKNNVIKNISTPVVRSKGPRGGIVVERSKPGQFPRADTTQLMKTIFSDYGTENGQPVGYVGTPLDYGLILETVMDRSFLEKTLNRERQAITDILTMPAQPGEPGS